MVLLTAKFLPAAVGCGGGLVEPDGFVFAQTERGERRVEHSQTIREFSFHTIGLVAGGGCYVWFFRFWITRFSVADRCWIGEPPMPFRAFLGT